jgi:phosphoglycolate phosphatase-like HAD superfamily hydrolase
VNDISSHFSSIEGIIFDLDGTLIKSKIDFIEMKQKIFRYYKSIGGTPESIHSSLLIPDIVSKILDYADNPELIQQMLERVNKIMNEIEIKHVDDAIPIPGVEEALLFLHKRGIKMSVLTRSCREYAIKCLEKVRFITFIDHLIARDDFHQSKPDPTPTLILAEKMRLNPDKILIVGDHALDLQCAKSANMPFLGVLTGSYTEKQFNKLNSPFISNLKKISIVFQN